MNSLTVQNKSKYYELYMKYKAEYLNLKKQMDVNSKVHYGGQVIYNLSGNNYLVENAMEKIVIQVINTLGDNIQ